MSFIVKFCRGQLIQLQYALKGIVFCLPRFWIYPLDSQLDYTGLIFSGAAAWLPD